MKLIIIICSFFLLGILHAGSSTMVPNGKLDLLEILSKTKDAHESINAHLKKPETPKFDYLMELANKTLTNTAMKMNEAHKKIERLPQNVPEPSMDSVAREVLVIYQDVMRYQYIAQIEETKLRFLSMAMLQCFEHDERIPEASELVEMVQRSVWANKELSDPEKKLLDVQEKHMEVFMEKMGELFDNDKLAEQVLKEQKGQCQTCEAMLANKFELYDNIVKEKLDVFLHSALPVDNEEKLIKALYKLSYYYKEKIEMKQYIKTGKQELPEDFADGEQRLERVIYPVALSDQARLKKSTKIRIDHSEL